MRMKLRIAQICGRVWGTKLGLAGLLKLNQPQPVLAFFIVLMLYTGCRNTKNTVVIYASQDQVYAEPILQEFTRKTGIQVQPLFDSEAVKTVGLAQRLLQERADPRCDVFWNNEALRTHQLAAQNVLRESNGWAAFGYRSRRLVINTKLLPLAKAPRSLLELTNAVWRGQVALAYPLFGTTATHFLALRQHWGESNWLNWCRALQANKPLLVDGNSVVVQLVGRGEAKLGLTDSDDIAAGTREGLPVASLPLNPEMLLIPNTVAVVRDAPHPEAAQKLFAYLQSPAVVGKLIAAHALEGSLTESNLPPTLEVAWPELPKQVEDGTASLTRVFLRE
jgi:iron(III) transport system substrate-binding protein